MQMLDLLFAISDSHQWFVRGVFKVQSQVFKLFDEVFKLLGSLREGKVGL